MAMIPYVNNRQSLSTFNPPPVTMYEYYNPIAMTIYNPPGIDRSLPPRITRYLNNTRRMVRYKQRARYTNKTRQIVRHNKPNVLPLDDKEQEEDEEDIDVNLATINNTLDKRESNLTRRYLSLVNKAVSAAAIYYNRSISYVFDEKPIVTEIFDDNDDIDIFRDPNGDHLTLVQSIVNLDVKQFKPDELTVSVSRDNVLTVEGTHRESAETYGLIAVHFAKRYVLAKTCNVRKIECNLSSDGVLTIKVPRVVITDGKYEIIQIIESGKPATLSKEEQTEEYYDDVKDINDDFCSPESPYLKLAQTIANLDVKSFKPEELSVKLTRDNVLTVKGTHHEPKDSYGLISTNFVKRYTLPKTCDASTIKCNLSVDGVLMITVLRMVMRAGDNKKIPIKQTGKPANLLDSEVEKIN